ncbi:MAG TPA: hypothetical protein VMJ10_08840, partial [Kofleriaceae bacterium]|nr:hypothetical protein [Kofleriaceae bacterium]
MTVDELVTTDLAALARDNRSELPQLVIPEPASSAPDLALLALSRIHVARFVRTAVGATAFACSVAQLLVIWDPVSSRPRAYPETWSSRLLFAGSIGALLRFAMVVLAAYAVAKAVAERRFDRATRDGDRLAVARARLDRLERRAVAWPILGITAATTTLGVQLFVFGDAPYWNAPIYAVWSPIIVASVAHVALALALACPATAYVVRNEPTWPCDGKTIALAVIALIATITIGLRDDVGPLFVHGDRWHPSESLRLAL